ncbi:hypothetical protein ACFP3Q_09665 [Nocardioides sp. GCM10027113]
MNRSLRMAVAVIASFAALLVAGAPAEAGKPTDRRGGGDSWCC